MSAVLSECRWLWNLLLEERIAAYRETGKGPTYFEQKRRLPILKAERPSLNVVHSQTLQDVVMRLDLAFQAFFRRVKAGEKPGFPRFRGFDRYDSFCFPQSGFSLKDGALSVSKVGAVRIKLHRPIEGAVKTLTLRRTSTHKWFACFSVEVDPILLPVSDETVGIDVGLASFATFSDGTSIENPRFFRTEEKALAKAQRRREKATKGTPRRRRLKRVVARVHERIGNRRRDFTHQQARKIVNRYGVIAVEDLRVNRMVHNHCLAKSIQDAAWSGFFDALFAKAEDAGRTIIAVNPAYTSQDCSRCGHRKKKLLSERWHSCECCGLELDRDHNAALNIMALGQQGIGERP